MLERLRRRVAAGTVAGAVLLADPDGWWRFAPLKWAVITTGCVVVAALTVAADGLRKPGRLGWLLLAWLVWLGVCSALGEDPRYAWVGTPERNAGWLMWVLCAAMLLCAVPWQAVVDGLIIAGCGLAPWLLSDAVGAAVVIRHRNTVHVRHVALDAAALIALATATTPVAGRTASTFDRAAAGGATRLDEWRVGLRAAGQHPLVGANGASLSIALTGRRT
jgi:hypothetical protein